MYQNDDFNAMGAKNPSLAVSPHKSYNSIPQNTDIPNLLKNCKFDFLAIILHMYI